jgi:hypothetical protein
MTWTFVIIRSWHLASGVVSRGGMIHTLCGRWAAKDAKSAPGLPAGKSCEACFRAREVAER